MWMHEFPHLTSYPWIVAVPLLAYKSPVKMLNVVVFPAPLTPSRPKHSPVGITRLIPLTANLYFLWQ